MVFSPPLPPSEELSLAHLILPEVVLLPIFTHKKLRLKICKGKDGLDWGW